MQKELLILYQQRRTPIPATENGALNGNAASSSVGKPSSPNVTQNSLRIAHTPYI